MNGILEFFAENAIYIVLVIVMIVWIGIFGYLAAINKRLNFIEKELKEAEHEE